MEKQNLFNVKEGIAFAITTRCENIEELKEASKKYSVKLPDVKFVIIYTDGIFEFYYEFKGYGVTEFAFGLRDPQIGNEDKDRIRQFALTILADAIDVMSWNNILKIYLAEKGIDYEEG